MMDGEGGAIWWIELIKIAPELITSLFAIALVVINRHTLGALLRRMTKVKGLGLEAEFAPDLDSAIQTQHVAVSPTERTSALKRLDSVAPLLRHVRILWIDDVPKSTKRERALLEKAGVRITTVTTSADAARELDDNEFLLVITDFEREKNPVEGLEFVNRVAPQHPDQYFIGYVASAQDGRDRPAAFFGVTNRPDLLVHYVCDIVEREKL